MADRRSAIARTHSWPAPGEAPTLEGLILCGARETGVASRSLATLGATIALVPLIAVRLDVSRLNVPLGVVMAVGAIAVLAGLAFGVDASLTCRTPGRSRVRKRLAERPDGDTVLAAIDRDLAQVASGHGIPLVLSRWIISSLRRGGVHDIDGLLWAYPAVKPEAEILSKTSIALAYADGSSAVFDTVRSSPSAVLAEVEARAPWVLIGYSPERMGMWSRSARRPEMVAEVEQRRSATSG